MDTLRGRDLGEWFRILVSEGDQTCLNGRDIVMLE